MIVYPICLIASLSLYRMSPSQRILSELRIIAVVYWAFQEDEAFEVTCDIVYGGSDLSKMDRGDEFQLGKPVAH